jgi:hypothetical protein
LRYYRIIISTTDGRTIRDYNSFPNGVTDPNALDMLIDAPVSAAHDPLGDTGALVRLWGIPLTDIAQSANFNRMNVQVFGGMQKGLPLANPSQSGLLVQGTIFQAFGNWIGTNMTLDLQILPGMGSAQEPANIVLNWPKGQSMGDALKQSIGAAFPDFAIDVNLTSALMFAESQWGVYQTLPQIAQWANQASKAIVGGTYSGVQMFVKGKTISVYDSTTPPKPTPLDFNDLIGQVTWIAFGTISVTCVMRAQPNVGDYITLPKGQVTINQASLSQFRQGSVFQGNFMIVSTHHVGHFRQPLSEDWVTVFTAVQVPPSTSGTGS